MDFQNALNKWEKSQAHLELAILALTPHRPLRGFLGQSLTPQNSHAPSAQAQALRNHQAVSAEIRQEALGWVETQADRLLEQRMDESSVLRDQRAEFLALFEQRRAAQEAFGHARRFVGQCHGAAEACARVSESGSVEGGAAESRARRSATEAYNALTSLKALLVRNAEAVGAAPGSSLSHALALFEDRAQLFQSNTHAPLAGRDAMHRESRRFEALAASVAPVTQAFAERAAAYDSQLQPLQEVFDGRLDALRQEALAGLPPVFQRIVAEPEALSVEQRRAFRQGAEPIEKPSARTVLGAMMR